MFNTTLTEEFARCAGVFGWDERMLRQLTLNAVHASLLGEAARAALVHEIEARHARPGRDRQSGSAGL